MICNQLLYIYMSIYVSNYEILHLTYMGVFVT